MLARAPASSANLGPGFDALAVALDRYVEVEIEPADRLSLRCEGEGAGLAQGYEHLAARVATAVTGHDRLAITVRSQIPVGRGMGSSAALATATAAAAGAADPLAVAAEVDGHVDNAAASMMGGLVASARVDGSVRTARLALDPALAFVLVVPDRTLSTDTARQVLPDMVSRHDAAFNLGRMGLLVAGLADHRLLSPEATEDRLHQHYRSALFPEAAALLDALVDGGALASCWSGAGSSLLGICTEERSAQVGEAAERSLRRAGLAGRVLALRPDLGGLVVGDEARLPSPIG